MRFCLLVCLLFLSIPALAKETPPAASTEAAGGSWNDFWDLGNFLFMIAPETAKNAYDQGNYAAAAPYLEFLHRVSPGDLTITKQLGFALKEIGRYEDAHDLLFEATVQDPGDWMPWWWLADTQRLLGEYKKAYDSMVTARDTAPETERAKLQEYVDYTEALGTPVQTWAVFEKHREFARRHEKLRRVRRTIAEYMSALECAPPVDPKKDETTVRIGWVNNQMGIQYNQLKEPDLALDHFLRSARAYQAAQSPPDVMMAYQNIGVTYRVLAEITPARAKEFLEAGAKYWADALKIAHELNDVPYIRYTQAGQLNSLAPARGLDDADVKALREANLKELPWKGPLNEYTTAAVALAELNCRMAEGDYAGARIVGEMALPFYTQSDFLLDTEETVHIYLCLAQAYTQQGHYDTAIEQTRLAQEKLDRLRGYMTLDAFAQSSNLDALRAIAVARIRASILKGDFETAQRFAEEYQLQARADLLGSKVTDDAARNDLATERELLKREQPLIEQDLAAAKASGAKEEEQRLTARTAADAQRAAWLEKGLAFTASAAVSYRALPLLGALELASGWPADTALVILLSDDFGSVGLVFDGKTTWGANLPEARDADVRDLVQKAAGVLTAPDQALPAFEALHARLLKPLGEHLSAKNLYFATDGPLAGIPLELCRAEVQFLIAQHDIAYVPSASYLVHLRSMPRTGAPGVRLACAGDACAPLQALLPGAELCANEICLAHATTPARLVVLKAPTDLSAPDPTLASITLNAEGTYDGTLYAAELLGAQVKADAAWLLPTGDAGSGGEGWVALAEGFMQAGVPAFIHPLGGVNADDAAGLLQPAAGEKLTLASFNTARRAAVAQGKFAAAHVILRGVCE